MEAINATRHTLTTPSPHKHHLDTWFTTIISVYFICIITFGFPLNTLLIYLIRTTPRLRTVSNYFIINLCAGHLLRAVLVLPFHIDYILNGDFQLGEWVCGLKETIFVLSLPCDMFNLLLLTTERLLILLFPFQHKVLFTKGKLMILLVVSWIYDIIVAGTPLVMNNSAVVISNQGTCFVKIPTSYLYFLVLGNLALPFLMILGMNFTLVRLASRLRNNRNLMSRSSKNKASFSSNYRCAKTIMVLVGNTSICWLVYVTIVTRNILGWYSVRLTWIGIALNNLSIATNPLIYGFLNKSIRRATLMKYDRASSLIREKANVKTTQMSLHRIVDNDDSRYLSEKCNGQMENSMVVDGSGMNRLQRNIEEDSPSL